MSKRDYYEVLGVSKGASGPELKKAFKILIILKQQKNLKKLQRHMMFYQILKKNQHMINLAILVLMEWVVVDLILMI
jgi:curved DNA-binding protein CbpA